MEKKTIERDPVCKMKVSEECQIRSTYKGKEYHFCSKDCKKAFDIAPDKYVEKRVA
ncbi:MAG: YHS domain-containing protein [Chloroflexota bacterium]